MAKKRPRKERPLTANEAFMAPYEDIKARHASMLEACSKVPYEAFHEAVIATERIIAAEPQRNADPTLPIFQLFARERLERYRQAFEAGNRYCLMLAIRVCANHELPLPGWASTAYIRAFDSVQNAHAKSWDEVFGAPYPKGSHLAAIKMRKELLFAVLNRIKEIRALEPDTPIDESLFERVGAEFEIGKTLTAELYYSAKAALPTME